MSFEVIIPVVNVGMFNTLIRNILSNSQLPSTIIVINNTGTFLKTPYSNEISFNVVKPEFLLPVNTSWNLGISLLSDCDFVSILNDDIEIPKTFFERIYKGFETISNAGAICPVTVIERDKLYEYPKIDTYIKMNKKEGWAFSLRKDVLDTIPPIPSELKTFYGDDWFWWHVYRGGTGHIWYKDTETVIYHAVGTALKRLTNTKERNIQKKKEKFLWCSMKTEFAKSGVCKL